MAVKAKVSVKRKTIKKPTSRGKAKAPAAATNARMAELERYKARLLAEQERLRVELQEIEIRTARTSDSERATEFSGYEDHPADLASETFEREKDFAIGESVESLLQQVETALEKIELGTYGICDACGRPIKKARLEALPFATLCVDCKDRMEG